MSVITGREEISRIKNEDMLVREMNSLIQNLEKTRDECSENKYNSLKREIVWKKIRDMQKVFNKG